ncbi:hypothetical protein ABPG72_009252 [Tetrahymena utriculariae]
MSEYYINNFHIQLNNDPQVLQDINKVYLYIQKQSKQNLITSTQIRNNTTVSFYNEEGFIFHEYDFSENPIRVEIHEYLNDYSNESNFNEQESELFNRDSLVGVTFLQLNEYSSIIFHPVQTDYAIGELIYTIKPCNADICASPNNLSANILLVNDLQKKYQRGDKQLTVFNNQEQEVLYESISSISQQENIESECTNQKLQITEPINSQLNNQIPGVKNNMIFLKLLNQPPLTQQQIFNEEESTETPTSKLVSSQGDLTSSSQYIPNQMSKSTHVQSSQNEQKKVKSCISPSKILILDKKKIFNEILSPICAKKKNIQFSQELSNNTPKNEKYSKQDYNSQQQLPYQMQIQQNIVNNPQQIQSFTQYLAFQQNQNNFIHQYNRSQTFNQFTNTPIFTPPAQQQINRNLQQVQINSTPYSNGYQNIIHTIPNQQNNFLYKNINMTMSTPQHRIIPQQSIPQHIQSPQISVFRGPGIQSTPLQFKTSPFTINQRF